MHRKRLASIILLSFIVAAAALAALILLHHGTQTPEQKRRGVPLPSSLAGYPLAWSKSGQRAVQDISRMHWEPVHIEDAAIGVYGSISSPALILWVAKAEDACTLAEKMAEKMMEFEAKLPYTAPQVFKHKDVTFYVSIDRRDGSLHVFWCQNGYVIWLRASAKDALGDAIRQLIDFYREHG